MFLDMFQALDKVWNQGLIFKLRSVGVSNSLLNLIETFWSHRFQRILLNCQISKWLPVKADVPQSYILGPPFFLIYINDLSDDLVSTVKLFADDTSLFSAVRDIQKISKWAYKWKVSFNPDLNKAAHEAIFSRKLNELSHPKIFFNKALVF